MRIMNNQKLNMLYDFILEYQHCNNMSPTYEEMAKVIKVKSKETIYRYIAVLESQGRIKKNNRKYRNIEIINPICSDDFVTAREVGSIQCGLPNEETERFGEEIALPSEWFGSGELYVLTASGDSMEDAGIEHGDKLIIKRQETASNGDIVVALVDGHENTLKRFYDEGSHCKLVAENKNYEDIITYDCKVQGVLVSCIKFY